MPAGTVAVSGNVTVTGQSTLGWVAVGPSLTWPPGTSTINFPVGDIHANGIVVPVSTTWTLSALFSGRSSSSTTNLVFDLTGYFLPPP